MATQASPIALEGYVIGQTALLRVDAIDPTNEKARTKLVDWDGNELDRDAPLEYPLGAIQLRKETPEAQRAVLELIVKFFYERREPDLSFLEGFRVISRGDFLGNPSLFVELAVDKFQGTMQDPALKKRVQSIRQFKEKIEKHLDRVQKVMRLDPFPSIYFNIVGER